MQNCLLVIVSIQLLLLAADYVTAPPSRSTSTSTAPPLTAVTLSAAERAAGKRKNKNKTATASPTTTTPDPIDAMMAPSLCTNEACQAPFCQCITSMPPNGIPLQLTPQMVLFVFHDSVTADSLDTYRKLFPLTRRNAHGCAQSATIFVDVNNNTDYCLMAKLWERGIEIGLTGSTSSAQSRGQQFWQHGSVEELTEAMKEWRQQLHEKSHIPISDLRGWRTPFSQSGGDKQFLAMRAAKFMYDSTLSYRNVATNSYVTSNMSKAAAKLMGGSGQQNHLAYLHNQFYPFTLDYNPASVVADCTSYPCPKSNHAGIWEVPMTFLTDLEGEICRFADNCQHQPEDEKELLALFQVNLFRAYKHRGNRAPVMFNFGARWHTKDYIVKAIDTFLAELSKMQDVYVVTMTDAIRWMQQPTPTVKIHNLDSWMCRARSPIKCRSEGTLKMLTKKGGSGTAEGWDIAPPNLLFGRFNRHLWAIELGVLITAYIVLRIIDR